MGQEMLNNRKSMKLFEFIKCIGTGGFSKVYLVRAYGILMALKVIEKEFIIKSGKY